MRKRHLSRFALVGRVTATWLLCCGAVKAEGDVPQPEPVQLDPLTPYFHLQSDRSVGDHGEITLDVSVADAGCGLQLRFDHAELEILRNRFGDAQFIRLPQPGCEICEPILLRWMHEPTGYLEINVNVFRRQVRVPCEKEY